MQHVSSRLAARTQLRVACGTLHGLQAAVAGAHVAIAFTRRSGLSRPACPSLAALQGQYPAVRHALCSDSASSPIANQDSSNVAEHPRVALVFGREESGLTVEELEACSHLCSIPTGSRQPSLNLSHAVAVCLAQCFDATRAYVTEAQPGRAIGSLHDADSLQSSGGAIPMLCASTCWQAGCCQQRLRSCLGRASGQWH
jgi:SpoU rRNA Methylase family